MHACEYSADLELPYEEAFSLATHAARNHKRRTFILFNTSTGMYVPSWSASLKYINGGELVLVGEIGGFAKR